jgi:hypothetical protein
MTEHPGVGWGPAGWYAGPQDPLVSADFNGWWRRSFLLLKAAWRPMALVQLVSFVPTVAVTIVSGLINDKRVVRFDATTGSAPIDWWAFFKPFLELLPFLVLVVLVSMVVSLATSQVMVQVVTGRPVSIPAALRTGLRRLLPFIGWGVLAGPLILVGFLLCFLPGVYVFAVVAVLPLVVLLERGKGIGRCFELFHADFGASIARVATIGGLGFGFALAEFAFSSIITAAAGPIGANAAPSPFLVTISAVVSALFSLAGALFFGPMLLTAYADMRARREPFSTAYLALPA